MIPIKSAIFWAVAESKGVVSPLASAEILPLVVERIRAVRGVILI